MKPGCPGRPGLALLLLLLLPSAGAAPSFEGLLPDPWDHLDDLLAAGDTGGARAFAEGLDGPAAAALRRYLAAPPPESPEVRAAWREAMRILAGGDPGGALGRLEGSTPVPGTILAMRLLALRGALRADAGREEESADDYRLAGEAAAMLGRDLAAEFAELAGVVETLLDAPDPREQERACLRLLGLAWMGNAPLAGGVCELNMGAVYGNLALPDRALPHLRRALRIFEAAARAEPDRAAREAIDTYAAKTRVCSARARALLGDLPGALGDGEAALLALRQSGSPLDLAYAARELGAVHAMYGGHSETSRLCREALARLAGQDEEVRRERARLLVNEGNSLMELGRGREARVSLEKALDCLAGLPPGPEHAVALMNLGEVAEKEGDFPRAEGLFRQSLGAAGGDRVLRAYGRLRIGSAMGQRGTASSGAALEGALGEIDASVAELGEASEPRLRLLAAASRGEVLLALGLPARAAAAADAGFDLLDRLTGGLADGEVIEGRAHDDRRRLSSVAIRAAAASGEAAPLFAAMERSRARAFRAALGGRTALLARIASPREAAGMREAALRSAAEYRVLQVALRSGDIAAAREAARRLGQAREDEDVLLRSVERSSRRAGPPCGPEADADAVLRTMAPDEAFLMLASLPEATFAVVLAGGAARITRLPGAGDLGELIARLGDAAVRDSGERLFPLLDEMAKRLVRPLGLPADCRKLHVCPDGALLRVPWPEVVRRATGSDIETWLIPSAGAFVALGGRRTSRGGPRIAIGDPEIGGGRGSPRVYAGGRLIVLTRLPGAAEEAQAVACREGDVALTGARATEPGLTNALAGADHVAVLHFACHGLTDSADPARSSLVLAEGEGADGLLTAAEIFLMRVSADLVVLSACQTAGDREAAGEGMLGLTRAFLLAGAVRVLAGLWPISDTMTRDFMASFYRELGREGVTTAQALARARMSMGKDAAGCAVRTAFVLWGVPD